MIGLKESFQLMYSNTHLKSRETLPLKAKSGQLTTRCKLSCNGARDLLKETVSQDLGKTVAYLHIG